MNDTFIKRINDKLDEIIKETNKNIEIENMNIAQKLNVRGQAVGGLRTTHNKIMIENNIKKVELLINEFIKNKQEELNLKLDHNEIEKIYENISSKLEIFFSNLNSKYIVEDTLLINNSKDNFVEKMKYEIKNTINNYKEDLIFNNTNKKDSIEIKIAKRSNNIALLAIIISLISLIISYCK